MDNCHFHHIFAMMNTTIQQLLEENARRNSAISQPFDPSTGDGAPLPRTCVKIDGYFPSTLFMGQRINLVGGACPVKSIALRVCT